MSDRQNRVARARAVPAVRWNLQLRASNGAKAFQDHELLPRQWIYHYLEAPYALSIFEHRRLRLSAVASWTDPYERWWCHELFNRAGPLKNTTAYGVCWTRNSFNEPHWRMVGFGRRHPIVRIRCSVNALAQAMQAFVSGRAGSCFLGTVRYERESLLLALADRVRSGQMKDVTREAANLLMRKRRAFQFEREVRLLWVDRLAPTPELFIPLDPSSAVSQVMLSPHAAPHVQAILKRQFEAVGVSTLSSLVLHPPGARAAGGKL